MTHFVYSNKYNIGLFGLEKLHSFDTCKFSKIYEYLKNKGVQHIETNVDEITEKELRVIHTQKYLDKLNSSGEVGKMCELYIMMAIPNFLVQRLILSPMRYQVKGTIMAGEIVMERVIKRDELVMKVFRDREIPIVMVLSGGYSAESARVISMSLHNLYEKL